MAVFILDSPFKELWRKAYIRTSKDGRKRIDLFNTNNGRTTISYARYLMCVKLGYILSNEYEVDHKNRDTADDSIDNLEVLTIAEHREKTKIEATTGRTKATLSCKNCGENFEREKSHYNEQRNVFCSSRCNQKYNASIGAITIGVSISDEEVNEIKRFGELGKSGYWIAKELGISANTVIKYLKKFQT